MTLRNQCAFVYRISYTIYGTIQLVRFDLFDLFCFAVWNIVFNFGRKVSAKEEKQRQQHCQTLATVNSLPLSLFSLPLPSCLWRLCKCYAIAEACGFYVTKPQVKALQFYCLKGGEDWGLLHCSRLIIHCSLRLSAVSSTFTSRS